MAGENHLLNLVDFPPLPYSIPINTKNPSILSSKLIDRDIAALLESPAQPLVSTEVKIGALSVPPIDISIDPSKSFSFSVPRSLSRDTSKTSQPPLSLKANQGLANTPQMQPPLVHQVMQVDGISSIHVSASTNADGESKIAQAFRGQLNLNPRHRVNGVPCLSFKVNDKINLVEKTNHIIVVKFSHNRPRYKDFESFLLGMKFSGSFKVAAFDRKHVFIEFCIFEDSVKLWLLKNCPIHGFMARFFRWDNEFNPEFESFFAPVWIHLPCLPLYLFDEEAALSMALIFGKPLYIDPACLHHDKVGALSMCVAMDVRETGPSEFLVEFVGDGILVDRFSQKVVYGDVPTFCSHCSHLGHDLGSCKVVLKPDLRGAIEERRARQKFKDLAVVDNGSDIPVATVFHRLSGLENTNDGGVAYHDHVAEVSPKELVHNDHRDVVTIESATSSDEEGTRIHDKTLQVLDNAHSAARISDHGVNKGINSIAGHVVKWLGKQILNQIDTTLQPSKQNTMVLAEGASPVATLCANSFDYLADDLDKEAYNKMNPTSVIIKHPFTREIITLDKPSVPSTDGSQQGGRIISLDLSSNVPKQGVTTGSQSIVKGSKSARKNAKKKLKNQHKKQVEAQAEIVVEDMAISSPAPTNYDAAVLDMGDLERSNCPYMSIVGSDEDEFTSAFSPIFRHTSLDSKKPRYKKLDYLDLPNLYHDFHNAAASILGDSMESSMHLDYSVKPPLSDDHHGDKVDIPEPLVTPSKDAATSSNAESHPAVVSPRSDDLVQGFIAPNKNDGAKHVETSSHNVEAISQNPAGKETCAEAIHIEDKQEHVPEDILSKATKVEVLSKEITSISPPPYEEHLATTSSGIPKVVNKPPSNSWANEMEAHDRVETFQKSSPPQLPTETHQQQVLYTMEEMVSKIIEKLNLAKYAEDCMDIYNTVPAQICKLPKTCPWNDRAVNIVVDWFITSIIWYTTDTKPPKEYQAYLRSINKDKLRKDMLEPPLVKSDYNLRSKTQKQGKDSTSSKLSKENFVPP